MPEGVQARRATITGLGVYVPPAVLTNDDLARRINTSDEWITTRTGIKRRHVAGVDQATSDLGILAARAALDDAGVGPAELDLIIVGTATPDSVFPSSACLIQERLGSAQAGAFDLLAACSSFVYGLNTAAHLIAAGTITTALVIGAETLTRLVDWNDRRTAVLIGDGAAAAVVQPSSGDAGLYSTVVGADGAAGDMIKLPAGGSRIPMTSDAIERNLHRAYMDGQAVFKLAVRTIPTVIRTVVGQAGWTLADIDLVVPHQANLRIIDAMADQLKLPLDRFFVNIQEYGNTSAASVPLALYEARQAGRLADGNRIVMAAFGGGFTYAACTMRWGR